MDDDIRDLDRRRRQRQGIERERAIRDVAAPLFDDSPGPIREKIGGNLVLDGDVWLLEGWPLTEGDELELYTNASTGWVRGRFSVDGEPRLSVQLWDLNGPRDPSGRPPWVGLVHVALPARAVLRRVRPG